MKNLIACALLMSTFGSAQEATDSALCLPRVAAPGKIDGFTCKDLGTKSNLYKSGVRDQDVIVRIDGVPVTQPKQMVALAQSPFAREITVLRAGKEVKLAFVHN